MDKTKRYVMIGAALLLAAPSAWALDVGDRAPALSVKKWVVNRPVTARAARGKVLVVEFWATWCPPCRTSIPHLNKLHEKYGDKQVVICGITSESPAKVQEFIKSTPMKYHVGIDSGKTGAVYMKGVRGIPHAFVVDREGKVAWHGHPMGGMDAAIEKLVAEGPGGGATIDESKPLAAARELSTSDDLAVRDLEKALELARKAYSDSGRKSAEALAVLARVHYEMGHLATAARAAEKAATLASGDEKGKIEAAAEYYRKELERRRSDPAAKF